MKRTTIIMIICFVVGLVSVSSLLSIYIKHNLKPQEEYYLGGPHIITKVDTPHNITFNNDDKGYEIKIKRFKGISIHESDTARMTTIHTTSGWAPFLHYDSRGDNLTLTVDYDSLVSVYSKGTRHYLLRFRSENMSIATVILPKGSLKSVKSRKGTIFIDSIRNNKLLAKVDDRLLINASRIDTLNSRSKMLSELKLSHTVIENLNILSANNDFRVSCSLWSVINNMYVNGIYPEGEKACFDFSDARIDDFTFNPDIKNLILQFEAKPGESYNFK